MRHIKSFSRRAAAFTLALLLALPTVYADAGERKLQTSTQIVDGLTYRNTITVNNDRRIESFSMELAPGGSARPILLQGSETVYGGANINTAVSNARSQGWNVLGAVNTDFFAMSNGVPLGIVIENGVFKSGTSGENAMAITNDLVSIVESPRVAVSLYDHTSDVTTVPNSFNKARSATGGIYLLNGYFSGVSTRSDGDGWYVRMKALPDPNTGRAPELTVNSQLTLEVTELILSDQSIVIGPDEYILTSATQSGYGGVFDTFQLGDQITLSTSCADPVLSSAQWAGGVGDIMVQNGALTDSSKWTYNSDGRQPRTAMGIKPDGTLVLYAVDGRQSGYSSGLSQRDLALELLAQGCTTAVNLDGGGSTALSVWIPGQTGTALQNKPSGGTPRSCATYLFFVTDQTSDGQPDRLVVKEDGLVVLAGSSLPLPQVNAIDRGLKPASADLSGLTYRSQNGLGTVDNDTYTAGNQPGTDTLLFTAGSLAGSTQIHVVDQLTDLSITRPGSSVPLTSLTMKPGEQVHLDAVGSYWGRTALRDLGPAVLTVQGDIGTVDSSGTFTAGQEPGTGTVTLSSGGLSRTLTITIPSTHEDVTRDHWSYEAVEYCYQHGIVSGISPTLFGRDLPISRANFIVMLHNAVGQPAASSPCTFLDVPADAYYAPALAWAQGVGLASGVGGGNFAPTANITREQAFALLYRFLPLIDKSCPDASLSVLNQFSDRNQISSYAQTASATLVSQGLVSGGGGFLAPQSTLARAEMASLLYRLLEFEPNFDVTPQPGDPDPSVTYRMALDQSQVTLPSGGSVTLNAVILPALEGAQITWSSSDPNAAAVSASGMVTNLYPGAGSKTVTVTASWNGLSSRCSVTCQPAQHVGTVINAENGLNVRSGPGTTYDRIGALRNNSQVVVLAQDPSGWYQVLFRNPAGNAAIGYVMADYLTLNR